MSLRPAVSGHGQRVVATHDVNTMAGVAIDQAASHERTARINSSCDRKPPEQALCFRKRLVVIGQEIGCGLASPIGLEPFEKHLGIVGVQ